MTVNSADGVKAAATSAIDTGDVDTEGGAPAPPAHMTIGNTNNPTGLGGTMPIGPSDDTHVVNSDTAESPTLKDTSRCAVNTGDAANDTMTTDDPEPQPNDPDDDTPIINVDIAPTVGITEDIDDATMAVDQSADAQPNGDAFVVPVGQQRQRKRRCSPAKIERQQRRRWYDGQARPRWHGPNT